MKRKLLSNGIEIVFAHCIPPPLFPCYPSLFAALLVRSYGGVCFSCVFPPLRSTEHVYFRNIATPVFRRHYLFTDLRCSLFSGPRAFQIYRGISGVIGRSTSHVTIPAQVTLLDLISDVAHTETVMNVFVANFIEPRYPAHLS